MTTTEAVPTVPTAIVASARTERPDLSGWLCGHAGMRQEFGLLATVASRSPGPEAARLVEDQIAMVLETLHHHHTGEDEMVWPILRERAPEAVAELDMLEAEHVRVDPLITNCGDTTLPLADRACLLAELHDLINAHLDHEERVAIPLIWRHVTVAEWEALGERATRETPRRRLPLVFGWLASAATPELREAALANVAPVPRTLFRLFWWPSYKRRARRMYGPFAPATVTS
jgi:hypothetical protein